MATETKQAREGLRQFSEISPATNARSSSADSVITRGGRLDRVWDKVSLDSQLGHFCHIKTGNVFMLQCAGYERLTSIAGLEFVLANTVAGPGGQEMPNPYITKNDQGLITSVYLKGAVVGRNAIGTKVVVQETLHFDPQVWFQLALIKLAENPQVPAELVGKHSIGDLQRHEAAYAVDESTAVVLDLRHFETKKLLKNRATVQRDATKRAQTVLKRRLFTSHPGLPGLRLSPDSISGLQTDKYGSMVAGTAEVCVMGWVDNQEDVKSLASAIERGEAVADASLIDHGTADLNEDTTEAHSEAHVVDEEAAVQRATAALQELRERGMGAKVAEILEGIDVELSDLPVDDIHRIETEAGLALAGKGA